MTDLIFSFSFVTLISLCATIFIVLLNLQHAKENLRALDFKTVVIELVTLTIWVSMFIRFLKADTPDESLANLVLFILSIAFGVLLIRSVMRERRIRGTVDKLKIKQNEINIRLRNLDLEKTEFVSLASHQLRGPLSSIQGYSSMIMEGEFGKVPKHLVDPINKILQSSRVMGNLINDFLDVTKIEKNELEYDIQSIDLVKIVDSVVENFSLAFERDEIKLISSHNKNEEVIVLGDPIRIQQMLGKILDNALKYTKIGSVTVSLAIKNGDAIVTVSDTGIGIKEDEIKELFKKFKRADNANGISIVGSGLGLYVAKEIAEAQGGRIWVESQGVGRGSKFFVALPLSRG